MAERLLTIDQIRPGFLWQFPRILDELNWQNWYDGHLQSALPAATINNGRKLFDDADLIKVNLFKMASQFYEDATLAERPAVTGDEGVIRWLADENAENLWDQMGWAVKHWSVKGRAILAVAQNQDVEAVDPSHYFRVGSFRSKDELAGHVIAVPYREYTASDLLNSNAINTLNRLRVTRFQAEPVVNDVSIYEFTGTASSGTVGNLISTEEANLQAIMTAGDGYSWYGDARDVTARLMIRLTTADRELNRFMNRINLVPSSLIEAMRRRGEESLDATQVMSRFNAMVDPVLTSDTDDGDVGKVTEDLGYEEGRQLAEAFVHMAFLMNGVPLGTYGLGISPDASGVARERAQDPAAARIRTLRRGFVRGLLRIIRAMGAPDGQVYFSWQGTPFEDKKVKEDSILAQYKEGLIEYEEAREALGWGPAQAMGKMPRQQPQNPRDRQQQRGQQDDDGNQDNPRGQRPGSRT